ncbi:MAG: hypothetical protein WCD50_07040 [Onishia taeanensis]|uniref:hypothetical protein n=1 Tax=Onishia taeanensis TaxID=284577 RepID=UPI003C7CA7B0
MKRLTPASALALVERRVIEPFDGLGQGLAGRFEVSLTLLTIRCLPTAGQSRFIA